MPHGLRTRYGRNQFVARTSAAATEDCDWLDEVFPPNPTTTPRPEQCRGDAGKRIGARNVPAACPTVRVRIAIHFASAHRAQPSVRRDSRNLAPWPSFSGT